MEVTTMIASTFPSAPISRTTAAAPPVCARATLASERATTRTSHPSVRRSRKTFAPPRTAADEPNLHRPTIIRALRASCEDTDVDEKQRFRLAHGDGAAGHEGARLVVAAHAPTAGVDSRAVVLVEGISDQRRSRRSPSAVAGILTPRASPFVPIGGAQAIGRFLDQFGPPGLDVRLAGLCDAGEEGDFRRGLERAGLGSDLTSRRYGATRFLRVRRRPGGRADPRSRCRLRGSRSSTLRETLDPSARSRSSLRGEDGRSRSSFGASWAAAAAGRSDTRVCSSMRSISPRCLGRSTWFLLTSEQRRPHLLRSSIASARWWRSACSPWSRPSTRRPNPSRWNGRRARLRV